MQSIRVLQLFALHNEGMRVRVAAKSKWSIRTGQELHRRTIGLGRRSRDIFRDTRSSRTAPGQAPGIESVARNRFGQNAFAMRSGVVQSLEASIVAAGDKFGVDRARQRVVPVFMAAVRHDFKYLART
jgi:hypothetical protein